MIVIDKLGPFHQQLHQTSTLRGSIVQHKQGIQLCSGSCYDIKFQYFWDFNKCLQAIFSQLIFENFWLYRLGARLFWPKITKKNHLLKSVNWRSELSSHQIYSKMLRKERKGSLISISSESSKIHLLIKVLYRPICFDLCRRYILLYALNVSLCY